MTSLYERVKEALFTGAVVAFVCPELNEPCVRVFEDNQGGNSFAANPLSYARTKHIDMRMCYSLCFFPVSGFPHAGLPLAVLRSLIVLDVFPVRQCCEEPGRVFV